MSNPELTQKVKEYALSLGVDLVGVASADRWARAPVQHSPRGIMPGAQSAIVCAVKIPDACIELGSEKDVREPELGLVIQNVAASLNQAAFKIAHFLEAKGHKSTAVPQTIFWRYRPSEGNPRGWIADICHMYAAAAAGLGEIGWHNLCITPEFGPRQRFVTIITEAELDQDPLYSGPRLCDKCMLCAKNCPMQSFEKEANGTLSIEIEDKKYEFANRNLWRCGMGENFQLDVLLDWPNKIDENFILEMTEKAVTEHPEWIKGWKMGICLKSCVNPQRRYFDKSFSSSARRKRDLEPDFSEQNVTALLKTASEFAEKQGADIFISADSEKLDQSKIDAKKWLPTSAGMILIGFNNSRKTGTGQWFKGAFTALRTALLFEKAGFDAATAIVLPADEYALILGAGKRGKDGSVVSAKTGEDMNWEAVLIQAPIMSTHENREVSAGQKVNTDTPEFTAEIRDTAIDAGADLFGITSSARINELEKQLTPIFKDDNYFTIENGGWHVNGVNIWGGQALPYNPEVKKSPLKPKALSDYLPDARSVIVVGVKLPSGTIESAGKGEGKKAGHYAAHIHRQAFENLRQALQPVSRKIKAAGYDAVYAPDLMGLASTVYCSQSHDLTACRFAAIAAGLGELGLSGHVLTPEFGAHQRFAALVTNAPLSESDLFQDTVCLKCEKCASACPARAVSTGETASVTLKGRIFTWRKTDRLKCDWAKRYGLLAESGTEYMGSNNNFETPEQVTAEKLLSAVKASDRMQRPYYSSTVEKCFTECPAGKTKEMSTQAENQAAAISG